jgi:serine/threonine protein kinase
MNRSYNGVLLFIKEKTDNEPDIHVLRTNNNHENKVTVCNDTNTEFKIEYMNTLQFKNDLVFIRILREDSDRNISLYFSVEQNKHFVIKTVYADDDVSKYYPDECIALCQLNQSPFICQSIAMIFSNGSYYVEDIKNAQPRCNIFSSRYQIAMKYHGKNLEEWVRESRTKQIDLKIYLHICLQMCRAVQHVHSFNILHTDIKLSNFFIDDEYNVKLGDFGICLFSENNDDLFNIIPEVMYTFGYRAPEVLIPVMKKVDFACDIWALGCCFFELFTREAFIKYKKPCTYESQLAEVNERMNHTTQLLDTNTIQIQDIPLKIKRLLINILSGMLQIKSENRTSIRKLISLFELFYQALYGSCF